MVGLSGIRCHVCGMALENPNYVKDPEGTGVYWSNPLLNSFTDVRLDFCGPQHSSEWYGAQIEARKNITPDT